MRFLLDTNVLSDVRRDASEPLRRWFARQPVFDLAISAITLLELDVGARILERRDLGQGRRLRGWLDDEVMPAFDGRVLPVDVRVALAASALHVPDPMPHYDGLIAATAMVNNLTLVTRNRRDMERTGVRILSPWDAD